jgi:serine/threonine protein kinase/Leucine-rich repeat (LRR) protein
MTDETIFATALAKADPAERAAFLAGACGDDTARRQRLEGLLMAHARAADFLERPPAAAPDPDHGATQALTGAPAPGVAAGQTTSGDNGAADDEPLTFLAPPTRPDALGRIGHYEVLQVLGRGGFGIVFRAFDQTLQRVVALKVMAPQLAATSPARKRFLREARSSAQVRHENVVQVYEVAEQPLPYLAMEFIPGETLQQRLDRVGPLDVPEALRIGRQIAEGLAAAHATDLIHRDIKPGNVLLESGQQKVRITDFGLARTADDASISQSGIIAGTPMYMAPEQAQGQTLDQRADLFSLGSVLYQMVAGRPPFRATTAVAVLKRVAEDRPRAIREIIPETPQWLCDIIAKLHAKDPDDRYQSAREVADVLADCEAQLKANARLKDYSRIPRSKPQRSRRRWLAAATVLLLPIIALAATELTGVTDLFHKKPEVFPPPDPAPSPGGTDSEGWVKLFNGRDLSGWKTHPDQPGQWKVEGGVLIGRAVPSYLYSDGGHFANFHLRVEARVNNGGDSGIFFRAPFATRPGRAADQRRPAGGYEVELVENPTYLVKTGSVWDAETIGFAPKSLWVNRQASLTKHDEWFTLEIIAQGNHFVTKVNGTRTADCLDPRNHFESGHIALQVFSPLTTVEFRKIEIKELPSSPSPPPAAAPFTDTDVRRIAALPAAKQIEEVRKELIRRNPGFNGAGEHKIEDGVVTEFKIVTDQVTDIAPIRAFNALRVLDCSGTYTNKPNGLLADMTPLMGMSLAHLTHLNLSNTKVTDAGMVYFKDCKNLTALVLDRTQVGDAGLAHFRDCNNLTTLSLGDTRVGDAGLANFKDCKALTVLYLFENNVGDAGLVHFQDCKDLARLSLGGTKVSDLGLAHFKNCKNLKHLDLNGTQVGDAGLAPFKGMPLTSLWINNTGVTDLTPVQGMPLEEIRLTPKNITRGLDVLRDMKSLKTIGVDWNQAWPAAEFWERYDKGEFKE